MKFFQALITTIILKIVSLLWLALGVLFIVGETNKSLKVLVWDFFVVVPQALILLKTKK